MALQIPVMKFAEMKEKTELEKMEEVQQKLEAVFSDLTDAMTEVDKIVSDLICKEEQRKIWADFGECVDDDPEDDVDPEFNFNFDFDPDYGNDEDPEYDDDDDPEYDPDDMYKFDFSDIDRIYAEMKKEESEDAEYDDEEEEADREAWSGWDED